MLRNSRGVERSTLPYTTKVGRFNCLCGCYGSIINTIWHSDAAVLWVLIDHSQGFNSLGALLAHQHVVGLPLLHVLGAVLPKSSFLYVCCRLSKNSFLSFSRRFTTADSLDHSGRQLLSLRATRVLISPNSWVLKANSHRK